MFWYRCQDVKGAALLDPPHLRTWDVRELKINS